MEFVAYTYDGARLEYRAVEKPKGIIIICPGGGYGHVSPREAEPVAQRFRQEGWQAAVLYYSVAQEEGQPLGIRPMKQLARAIRRMKSDISPNLPVILCGFSAGGHLAASLGVHWQDQRLREDEDEQGVDERLLRPDGLILSYPVITAGRYAHKGSFANLAGDESWDYFSLENHVNEETPPAFIWHTAADKSVPVENSLLFAQQLIGHSVPVELHIYPFGPHGLSLATREVADEEHKITADSHVAGWINLAVNWLDYMADKIRS